MKSNTLGVAVFFCSVMLLVPETSQAQSPEHMPRYRAVDLGTLGGPNSYVNPPWELGGPKQMNGRGVTVGDAATSESTPLGCIFCNGLAGQVPNVYHAFKWSGGVLQDLGALPGELTNSVAVSTNAEGIVVGHSENGQIDPITGGREVRAVLWKEGKIFNLGTLGGNESFAFDVNDHGQAIGTALNGTPDPFSFLGLFFGTVNSTQTRGFLWQNGHKRDLGSLGGPDTWAARMNNRGEVVGGSYINSVPNPGTGVPTTHPFLWRHGKMIDLGNLGGTMSAADNINNRSQVTGTSTLAGDQVTHPFLWQNGKMIDLNTTSLGGQPISEFAINDAGEIVGGGAFPNHPYDAYLWKDGVAIDLGVMEGDCWSEALVINSQGVVAGLSHSCDGRFQRPFLWRNGHLYDLNQFIHTTSGAYFTQPFAINDRGEIAGIGVEPGCDMDEICGHAFVLVPID
jgi:probable HAF family extracellular repeat protein